jgi:uncharacterized glyoxalase superfamily protein PhnB/catechol 2,3-dioxygenase-like lactoylglutathione lyase family enzyme
MSEVELTEQLDQAIEALLRNPNASLPTADPRIADLLSVAADLRELPRAAFKARLKNELSTESADESSQFKDEPAPLGIREGYRTVTPYLTVADVHAEVKFISQAFGATGRVYGLGSEGGFHSEYQIGESMVMIGGGGEGSSWKGSPSPGSLHLYVENVDTVYERALEAGASSLYAPTDHEYGERGAAVRDAGGNHWYLATAQGPRYTPEGSQNLMPYLHPVGAPKQIEFLKQAFGAEEIAVHQSPDGIVHHGKIRVGNSVVEMGEAHEQWQPMPMHFMLYVEDCDAWYARAMKADGAISVGEPANQSYGGRTGTVKDPFGNTWYLSSQIAAKEENPAGSRRTPMASAKLFRVTLQVADLDKAAAFYAKLLDDQGISIPRGSRHYFNCGPVILALVDVSAGGEQPKPLPDYVYFAVDSLEQVYERAQALDCLTKEEFHDQKGGEMVKRPWGELSFYCEDPWGNGLCFVDEKTLFTGK